MPEKEIFVTKLTDINSKDVEGVGVLRWDGDKLYRWIYNADGAALTVGQLCCHTVSDGSAMYDSVDQAGSSEGDIEFLAGVIMAASLTSHYYGWIQVLGYNASVSVTNTTNTTVAAGGYIKAVDSASYGAKDADTQPSYSCNIKLLAEMTSAQTPAAAALAGIINCLG